MKRLLPTYPIAAEFAFGVILGALGLAVIVSPTARVTALPTWHWLWNADEAHLTGFAALCVASLQSASAAKHWMNRGKVASGIAAALWFQFAVKTYGAIPGMHPLQWVVYLFLAICNLLIVLTREPD